MPIQTDCTVTVNWLSTAEQEAEVDAAVDALLAELDLWDATEYEKIKGTYDWITENVQYDFDNYDDPTYLLKHSTYAALIQRVAVCQGYASLYYRLLLELGVDCRYISGISDNERHGWNIVRLEGKYYNCDPTWDRDLMGHYRYFLCTEANFGDHLRDAEFSSDEFYAQYPMAVAPYVFNVAASGKIREGLEWVLDGDTGILTVAGTGAIPSYRYSTAPWYPYRESVRGIVVTEGITEVGERAFYWCTNCTSVTLPESLIAIREYGFNNLRALQSITLPSNLKILEFCAFSECAALQSITLPDSVTTVGSSVFSNCPNLFSATLSAGMTTIPSSMFFNDGKLMYVTIPEGITYIDDTAFHSTNLWKVHLPASLTGMGSSVFAGCKGLKEFTVAEGNTAYKAVNGVLFTANGKTLICYPAGKSGNYTVPEGTEYIATSAFRSCNYLYSITFCSTLKEIGDYSFSYCQNLTSITLPKNVTRVCDSAFRSCTSLRYITFQNDSVILESGGVFAECDSLTSITLPAKLTEIPGYLFYGCALLDNVVIPSTATKIGSSAFLDCDSLTSITIPGNVKSIGRQAFDFCNRLRTIEIQEGCTTIEDYCIRNAPKLEKVVIPSSVTSIGREMFDECPNVTLYVNCGTYGESFAISKSMNRSVSHPYTVSRVVEPTCTTQGYTVMSCKCGTYSYNTNYVSAYGHDYIWEVTDPTCTTEGYTTYTCTRCGYWFEDDWVPATGHNFENGVCTDCGTEAQLLPLRYDDHYDVTGKTVELLDAGTPSSYKVGYGVAEGTLDDAVVTLEGNYLVATGIGTAYVRIDGTLYEITVTAAPISLLLIIGQSNAEGMVGRDHQSIACENGQVYSTYAKANGLTGDAGLTVENAGNYVPSALTGQYSTVNVNGTDTKLSGYPVNSLTEAGVGKYGMDSGIAYEWVKQTGEKVWVINAAHGASSISSWQPGQSNFEEANALLDACQKVLMQEIAAGHFTFSHMGYYWCQGCADETKTAQWYAEQYITMHNALKTETALDADRDPVTPDSTMEFGGIVLVMAGHENAVGYRMGTYSDSSDKFFATFKELEMRGPRVAQIWMANNPELPDIHLVCTLAQDWVTMPDGSDGVAEYFAAHYENGIIDYPTQVTQAASWYTPTTPAAVKDSIHYYQVGYNEVGRESVRNTLYILGLAEKPNVETTITFVDWTGYQMVDTIKTSTVPNSGTLVVPVVYPCYESKNVAYTFSDGLVYSYYDLLDTGVDGGTLTASIGSQAVQVIGRDYYAYRFELVNGNMVSVSNQIFRENPLTQYAGQKVYTTAEPIILKHDKLWMVEFNSVDTARFMAMATTPGSTEGMFYFFKSASNSGVLSIGEYKDGLYQNYGLLQSRVGIDWNVPHIYRFQNVLNEDGTNTIHIYIDDVWMGTATELIINGVSKGTDNMYLSGKDFVFTSIGCSGFGLSTGQMTYLEVWEYNCDHAYQSVVTAPTCTEQGYTIHTCTLCGDSYVDSYVDATGHKFGNWYVTKNATCTENGQERRDCANCDHYETRTVEATGHDYKSVITAPTCTEQGYTTHTCTLCGDSYVDSYVNPTGHKFGNWVVTKNATCTENGQERRDCANCDHYETRTVEATGHNYKSVVTTPTCTEQGYTTHTCTKCGDSYVDTFVAALGHNFVTYVSDGNATCTEDGTKTAKCERCDVTDTVTDRGSATGHKFGNWYVTKEATCTEDGSEQRDCENCDHHETRTITAAGHDYKSVVTAPTCTEKGYTTHTCTVCGNSYVDSYVNPTGHKFSNWTVVKAATCTEDGSERRDCDNCDHYETRTIKATGHNYKSVVTAPTCTEQGYTTHTCTLCGDSYVDSYVNPTGHKIGNWYVTKNASCTEDGQERRDCQNCDHYETRVIEATGHDYKSVVTDPTCTEQGYTTHTCSVCGHSYVDSYVNPTGHKFGNWTVVKAATCTEDGTERRDCANCDHYETRTVEATGHNYKSVVTAPTCTEQGYTTHTCAKCGDSYVDSYVDATGHKFGNWYVTKAATCEEEGTERRDCANCDHYETRTVEATRHNYKSVVTAPTCTEQGYTTHTCTVCGDSYVDTYVPALGHSYGEWYQTKAPTYEADGEERRDCSRCDEFQTRVVPMLKHEYVSVVTDPTCTEQGYTTHTCTKCGDTYVDTYVPALGHHFVNYVSDGNATCTEDGTKTAKCERCDATDTVVDRGSATGHKFGNWFVVKGATCTEDGQERRDCQNCDHYETRTIEATGHDYKSVVTAPTCTERGYTTHTCTKCGHSYIDSYVNATGHKFGNWTVVKAATCTEDGTERRDCVNCDHYETRTIKATGHNYESVVTAPTCTEQGYTTHTCSKCGHSYVDSETAALGHSFGPWEVIIESETGKMGLKQRVCAHCGHTETEEIPALDFLFGDTNSDGKVNGKDLILLRQSLAGWDVTIAGAAADCNGDGKINGKDLILLRQYLAGWDVELG